MFGGGSGGGRLWNESSVTSVKDSEFGLLKFAYVPQRPEVRSEGLVKEIKIRRGSKIRVVNVMRIGGRWIVISGYSGVGVFVQCVVL